MNLKKIFRAVGLLEALSFIVLIGISMPMKYALGIVGATKVPGMVHGWLFILYVILAIQRSSDENWPMKKLLLALLASVMPFGTLLFDQKFLSSKKI